MNALCKKIEPRLSAYIDRELDETERLQVEAHVAGCEYCAQTLAGLTRAIDLTRLAFAADEGPVVDLDGVWEHIDSELTRAPSLWERIRSALGSKLLWAPAALAAAVLLAVVIYPRVFPTPQAEAAVVESVYCGTGNVLVMKTPETGTTLIWILPKSEPSSEASS